ncbi:alpha/beta hydrolase [Nocardia uniformis]|uniref:Alpha/beta hydrolase n=1 Tax=Nocardia uniformis TaxID=53432 RepID=A0A849CGW2_9NOCA|nr:alpha/beta hydrolase [Nocardia uniformis]NNH72771.1 alpha/beta hydrolase [Nocardia uniformis]
MTAGEHREHRFPRESGGWLHVTEWGVPTAEVTVVLAHGWSLSRRSWEDVAERLVIADPTLRVIAYDHRGHGQSARMRASLELLADDLDALIDTLVPTGALVLGGHSMGGMTLMALGERHPELIRDRVHGVAFVATSAGDLPAVGRRLLRFPPITALAVALIAHLRLPSKPLFLARQFNRFGMFGPRPRRHDLNRVVWQAAQSHLRAVADMGASILRHDRYDTLAVFDDTDVVIMAGGGDPITPAAHSHIIAARLPHARLQEFPRAGHHLPYEHRDEVATELLVLTEKALGRIGLAG